MTQYRSIACDQRNMVTCIRSASSCHLDAAGQQAISISSFLATGDADQALRRRRNSFGGMVHEDVPAASGIHIPRITGALASGPALPYLQFFLQRDACCHSRISILPGYAAIRRPLRDTDHHRRAAADVDLIGHDTRETFVDSDLHRCGNARSSCWRPSIVHIASPVRRTRPVESRQPFRSGPNMCAQPTESSPVRHYHAPTSPRLLASTSRLPPTYNGAA